MAERKALRLTTDALSASDSMQVLTGRCLCEDVEYRIEGELGPILGGLDQAPSNKVEGHFFVGSKAPWFEITDRLRQHDTWPGSRTEVRKTSDEE